MLHLFDTYASLFKSWHVARYEQAGDAYLLQISARLQDDSRLELSDYLFADGNRTYAYQWMEADGTLRQRWDNTPHWPNIATTPHHTHLPGQTAPEPSVVTNLEDLLRFIQDWFAHHATTR
ncbi:MAG TPA: DUF6516 family protein [Anaerolineae bacterium]